MSKYRFTLELYVDDAALKAHDGASVPPPNDVTDWDASDIFAAAALGIVEPRDGTLEDIEEVPEE